MKKYKNWRIEELYSQYLEKHHVPASIEMQKALQEMTEAFEKYVALIQEKAFEEGFYYAEEIR